ncbi:DEAD/DEAH box helicase [Pontiellaceae bacterium B12219]|nr:DEAD/DEAH box helicase [Pontiellaceae bacterium B12219]
MESGPAAEKGTLSLFSLEPESLKKNFFYAGYTDPVHAVKVEPATGFDEKELHAELAEAGLVKLTKVYHWVDSSDPHRNWKTCESEAAWMRFFLRTVPELEAAGWTVERDASFSCSMLVPEGWYVDMEEAGDNYRVSVGFKLQHDRINVLPLLVAYLRDGTSEEFITLPDGRRVILPQQRIALLASTLLELLNKGLTGSELDSMEVSWLRALELTRLRDDEAFETVLPKQLKKKSVQLAQVTNAPAVVVPETMQATLRAYQQQGVNWLQLLRSMDLGAVLADDMGLGKTLQALTHVLIEKASGRMDAPCLIIAPTSVIYNWEAEAQKFAPSLKVHVSHGSDRADHFDNFASFDLILTTYPLLSRDGEELLKHRFHLLILDEAQFIRNHRTHASRVVRLLEARQRVALTGTPVENSLEDLWSLFSFVMPGLLGSHEHFRARFRNPIEKMGSETMRGVLARRIAPFLLRRTKSEVVLELPPKTEMVRRVELTQGQKELYETVRSAMDARVSAVVADKGVARSHIIVLDALLKMRQVCCHSLLLKSHNAKKIADSAKLDALMEMLVEMIPEGRRVLIFSQFTSMLKLIEAELKSYEVDYVKITGATKDRKTPVAGFQSGKVPVFLISLKAGGTGLNLTAADTVIHFDPWWNPAVEAQATDRAYRIGQDKPVFVYKLIAADSVEERVLQMQERKKGLLDGVLGDQKEALKKWDEADLEELFKPIGG